MGDKQHTEAAIAFNKDIYPTRSAKTAFVEAVAKSLASFLQNAYQFVLAKLIEQQRKDAGVRDLYDHFDQVLNSTTTDPTIRAQRRADLISLVANYINRTNQAFDKDFAAKALAELFSSLGSVSVDANQEERRKMDILESLHGVAIPAWKDAIFSIAIRTSLLANKTDPLQLTAALVYDESTAADSRGKATQISLYTLATDVIKKWISNAKLTFSTINGKTSTQQQASSSNGSTANVLFVDIVMHIFSSPAKLQESLKSAVNNVLEKYAELYVMASPSESAEVKILQDEYIRDIKRTRERAIKKSQTESLSTEAKLAYEYGISATTLINLAHSKGYYYGAGRQMNMFRRYECTMKDVAMERACSRVLSKVGQENSQMQSSLLSEVSRLMSQNQDVGTAQQYQLLQQLYEQQRQSMQSSQLPQQAAPSNTSLYPPQTQQQYLQQQSHAPANQGLLPFLPTPPQQPTQAPASTYPPAQPTYPPSQPTYPPSSFGYSQNNQYRPPNTNGAYPYNGQNPTNQYPSNQRQVSFAESSSTAPSSHYGKSYTSPPPPFQYKPNEKPTGQPYKPSPMTQNTSRRGPKPVYEDSSGEETDTDESSQGDSDSSGSGFEDESSDSDF